MEKNWLKEIANAMKSTEADMLVGSVMIHPAAGVLNGIQELEHFGFQIITQGSTAMKKPVLNTGANLCFKKDFFEKVEGYSGNEDISSGDDVFLLMKARAGGYKVAGLPSADSLVFTAGVEDFSTYFAQRFRWASKTIKYPDRTAFLGLFFDLSLRLICLGIPVFSGLSGDLTFSSFAPLMLKLMIDFLLVFLPSLQRNRPGVLIWFIPAFFLTVVTQLLVLIWILTRRKVQWKDRIVST